MIPRTSPVTHVPHWQYQLARAVTDPAEMLRLLDLPAGLADGRAARDFPFKVPRGFIARMRPGDPGDPLLRQVLPLTDENDSPREFSADPLDETGAMPVPGLLHKYAGRVLLTVTGACGIHCRYCFRRCFPYADANPSRQQWAAALEYLADCTDVSEIIFSGGDPLSMTDRRLADLAGRLDVLPHLRRLRIHTRLPVVLPERIDEHLLTWLKATRMKIVMVIHANHPNELDAGVAEAIGRLRDAGVSLLNQSVLLRDVNDNADCLAELSEKLISMDVLPYYLHQLDRVRGAAHFEVSDRDALALTAELQRRLPGYLVPKLCREEPGAASKTLLSPLL